MKTDQSKFDNRWKAFQGKTGDDSLRFPCFLQNRFDHLVTNFPCFWESWGEVASNSLKLLSVAIEVAQTDSLAPVLRNISDMAKSCRGSGD